MLCALLDPFDTQAHKKTVVIIDDEADHVAVLEHLLGQVGYLTACSADGIGGLSLVRAVRPDLVLLDVLLPGIDGFEVCARLQRSPETSSIPILIVTARGQEIDVFESFVAGAVDCLVKPFRRQELLDRVREALAAGRRPRAAQGRAWPKNLEFRP